MNYLICIHCDCTMTLHDEPVDRRVEQAARESWMVMFVPEQQPWGGRCPDCAFGHLADDEVECAACGQVIRRGKAKRLSGGYMCARCYRDAEQESERAFERSHGPEVAP